MAKYDLRKLIKYSAALYDMLEDMDDGDQLPAWVQAKIIKAADYMSAVYHYMDHEDQDMDDEDMDDEDMDDEDMDDGEEDEGETLTAHRLESVLWDSGIGVTVKSVDDVDVKSPGELVVHFTKDDGSKHLAHLTLIRDKWRAKLA